jgi:ribosomal protein L11 methyltransferase
MATSRSKVLRKPEQNKANNRIKQFYSKAAYGSLFNYSMNSIQLIIEAKEEQQEIFISQLSELGADGFEQTETSLIAYFNENIFESYKVNELLKGSSFTISSIEEKNWNEVWESNFQPVLVDNFCAIRAEFHEPIKNVDYEIIITPKMSFGTGHHATTYMMVEQMHDLNFDSKFVFDFGTGTGILSILAEKLGASKIEAIDVDDWSIANAKENLEKNKCSKISVRLSSQLPTKKFDIILANINRNVILDYLPQLEKCLNEDSYLLLSGLLASDQEDIVKACIGQNLKFLKQTERDNWISLVFIKSFINPS